MKINLFCQSPQGFRCHFEIDDARVPLDNDNNIIGVNEAMNLLLKSQADLIKWLEAHGYTGEYVQSGSAASTSATGGSTSTATAFVPDNSREPYWIQNDNGSRSCSVHGPGRLMPAGVSKSTGKPYSAFWGCQQRGCRPEFE